MTHRAKAPNNKPRLIFFQIYTKGGRKISARYNKRSQYPHLRDEAPDVRDLYLGTFEAVDIQQPHTALQVKEFLCRNEGISDPKYTKLYGYFGATHPYDDGENLDFNSDGVGQTKSSPIALIMTSHRHAPKPGPNLNCYQPSAIANAPKRLKAKYTHQSLLPGYLSYTQGEILRTNGTLTWPIPNYYMARNSKGDEGYISYYSCKLLD